MSLVNGEFVAPGSQFSLSDVEVVTATMNPEELRAHRSSLSRSLRAALSTKRYTPIRAEHFELSYKKDVSIPVGRQSNIRPRYHSPEGEITLCTGASL